jgi:hypothetical protein
MLCAAAAETVWLEGATFVPQQKASALIGREPLQS